MMKLLAISGTLAALMSTAALAQDGSGASTLHYMGAGLGAGIVVIGAGYGIGKLTAAATESIARQPQAAKDITAAFQLPLFLLEGVAGDPALNQPDGIHPTAEGHRRVAENVWKILRPIL